MTCKAFELSDDTTFAAHLVSRMYDLKESSHLTDFTIRLADKTIRCHKLVLAAASLYFDAMLHTGLEEAENDQAELKHLDDHMVEEIIKYFYTGRWWVYCNHCRE